MSLLGGPGEKGVAVATGGFDVAFGFTGGGNSSGGGSGSAGAVFDMVGVVVDGGGGSTAGGDGGRRKNQRVVRRRQTRPPARRLFCAVVFKIVESGRFVTINSVQPRMDTNRHE